jgi:hypothetical protein
MPFTFKRKFALAATGLAAAALSGGAYAATQGAGSRQAFLNDAAKRLNVTPQQLTAALRAARVDQVNAAVAAGRLTQAEGAQLKQRILHGGAGGGGFAGPRGFGGRNDPDGPHGFYGPRGLGGGSGPAGRPGFFGAPPAGPGHEGRLAAAAGYLGLTVPRLIDQLAAGKSLAQVAAARGKSTDGLRAAMLTAIRARLNAAVAAKVITAAEAQRLLSKLPARLDAQIKRRGFVHRGPMGHPPWPDRSRSTGPGAAGAGAALPIPPDGATAPSGAPGSAD